MNFPIFRKLSNNQRFYKIESTTSFTELQVVGRKTLKVSIQAQQFPEKLLIQDMISLNEPFLESNSDEFFSIENPILE